MNNLTIKWTALRSLLQGATLLTLWALISACSGSENTVSQSNSAAAAGDDSGVINLLFIGHTHREGEGGFHLSHLNASLFNQALGQEKIFMEYEIGRASCRERAENPVAARTVSEKKANETVPSRGTRN